MGIVAYDESGNTGADLLNPDQPVFALASIHLDTDIAVKLLPPIANEFHFTRARKSRSGREQILRILNSPELTADTVHIGLIHKPFMLVGKIIDLLAEPTYFSCGIDMYSTGQHTYAHNLLHVVGENLCPTEFRKLQKEFLNIIRGKTRGWNGFLTALAQIDAVTEGELQNILLAIRLGTGDLDLEPDLDALNPAIPALHALAHGWTQAIGKHTIIHDHTKDLSRALPILQREWARNHPEVTLWDGGSLRQPQVAEFGFIDSQESTLIQLADVIAGAARVLAHSLIEGSKEAPPFVKQLEETALMEWVTMRVWPDLNLLHQGPDASELATPWPLGRPT